MPAVEQSGHRNRQNPYIFRSSSLINSAPDWNNQKNINLFLEPKLTFSRDRFLLLIRAIRFDNKDLRKKDANNCNKDPIIPIREVMILYMASLLGRIDDRA